MACVLNTANMSKYLAMNCRTLTCLRLEKLKLMERWKLLHAMATTTLQLSCSCVYHFYTIPRSVLTVLMLPPSRLLVRPKDLCRSSYSVLIP